MITRIRVEAEGTTLNEVQRDLFATHDRIVEHLPPGITHTRDHVYEECGMDEQRVEGERWFRGRLTFAFPVDTAHAVDADRLNGTSAGPEPGYVPGYEEHRQSPDERVGDALSRMGREQD